MNFCSRSHRAHPASLGRPASLGQVHDFFGMSRLRSQILYLRFAPSFVSIPIHYESEAIFSCCFPSNSHKRRTSYLFVFLARLANLLRRTPLRLLLISFRLFILLVRRSGNPFPLLLVPRPRLQVGPSPTWAVMRLPANSICRVSTFNRIPRITAELLRYLRPHRSSRNQASSRTSFLRSRRGRARAPTSRAAAQPG